jgi:3-phosphoglycerate kinase
LLKAIVKRTGEGAISVIGGGDSVNLVNSLGLSNGVSFISTGGGASL